MRPQTTGILICSTFLSFFPLQAWNRHQQKDLDANRMPSIVQIINDPQFYDLCKFQKILFIALRMEGYLPTEPGILPTRTPRWSKYLSIYTSDYRTRAPLIQEYQQADFNLLDNWQRRNGPIRLTDFMTKLGYFDKQGKAKKQKISTHHIDQIISFASEIYDSPAPAS